MQPQLSQDYKVDARRTGGQKSVDNTEGLKFVKKYLNKRQEGESTPIEEELRQEDRFIVAGPGQSQYSFRNAFRSSK